VTTLDLVFSTAEVRREQRLSSLREAVCTGFLDLNVSPAGGRGRSSVEGVLSIRELGGLRVARFSGTPIVAARTRRHLDASRENHYLLAVHVKGIARASQCGRELTLRPGDLALLDSSRPYRIELANAGPFEHVAYQIPRARLDARSEQIERALARKVSARSDPGRLASPYLQTLASPSWRPPPASAAPLIETGLDVLVNALLVAAGVDVPAATGSSQLLSQLKQYAISRLGDPSLAPAEVAGAQYVSVRQLHRLFAREGTTFGGWIREERLGHCRRDLADPRLQEVAIAELARRWGYRGGAHFTRAFSARFGIGPRDFRQAACGQHRELAPGRPGGRPQGSAPVGTGGEA
jgi:AraC-like DNA-binding protein